MGQHSTVLRSTLYCAARQKEPCIARMCRGQAGLGSTCREVQLKCCQYMLWVCILKCTGQHMTRLYINLIRRVRNILILKVHLHEMFELWFFHQKYPSVARFTLKFVSEIKFNSPRYIKTWAHFVGSPICQILFCCQARAKEVSCWSWIQLMCFSGSKKLSVLFCSLAIFRPWHWVWREPVCFYALWRM